MRIFFSNIFCFKAYWHSVEEVLWLAKIFSATRWKCLHEKIRLCFCFWKFCFCKSIGDCQMANLKQWVFFSFLEVHLTLVGEIILFSGMKQPHSDMSNRWKWNLRNICKILYNKRYKKCIKILQYNITRYKILYNLKQYIKYFIHMDFSWSLTLV